MSVVSRYLGENMLYAQRRVYTAPEQVNYSGLPYLNPNNLNEKILEDEFPPEYEMPKQLASQNRYDPNRRPSDNLTIHMNYVPLQYTTYDMLDSRNGASVFNAPIPEVHPKLRTKAQMATASYANNLTKEQISFHSEYAKVGNYPYATNSLENIAGLIDSRQRDKQILYSAVSEPTGMMFKDKMKMNKNHRNVNAVGFAPELQAQEALRLFQRTGRWC